MLLREINIGTLTIIVEEEHGEFEIKVFENSGNRVFMHIYQDYEIVKSALDSITELMEKDAAKDTDVIEILKLSKDK